MRWCRGGTENLVTHELNAALTTYNFNISHLYCLSCIFLFFTTDHFYILFILFFDECFSILLKGNWNYFAANRPEKKAPKIEATHREKAMELYQSVCCFTFSLAMCYSY
jgi:hypothetical protein